MDFKQIPEHDRRGSQYDFFRVLAGKNRIRYYDRFKLARLPGRKAGARMVVEVDLTTGKEINRRL